MTNTALNQRLDACPMQCAFRVRLQADQWHCQNCRRIWNHPDHGSVIGVRPNA